MPTPAPITDCRALGTPRAAKRPRYLVVDRDLAGDAPLPLGVRGKVIARFHTIDLAQALASAEAEQGRRVLVLNAKASAA